MFKKYEPLSEDYKKMVMGQEKVEGKGVEGGDVVKEDVFQGQGQSVEWIEKGEGWYDGSNIFRRGSEDVDEIRNHVAGKNPMRKIWVDGEHPYHRTFTATPSSTIETNAIPNALYRTYEYGHSGNSLHRTLEAATVPKRESLDKRGLDPHLQLPNNLSPSTPTSSYPYQHSGIPTSTNPLSNTTTASSHPHPRPIPTSQVPNLTPLDPTTGEEYPYSPSPLFSPPPPNTTPTAPEPEWDPLSQSPSIFDLLNQTHSPASGNEPDPANAVHKKHTSQGRIAELYTGSTLLVLLVVALLGWLVWRVCRRKGWRRVRERRERESGSGSGWARMREEAVDEDVEMIGLAGEEEDEEEEVYEDVYENENGDENENEWNGNQWEEREEMDIGDGPRVLDFGGF